MKIDSDELKDFPANNPKTNDSMTKEHFLENAVYKYMTGQREPITIRIDKGLYSAFKPLAKRVYGSVCRAAEVYMVSFILAVESGVYFSNTDRPINIEKIVIERNLKPRRNLAFVEEEEVEEVATTRRVRRVRKVPDYSAFSLEELQAEYEKVKAWGDHARQHTLKMFIKKRQGLI
jgi:hypothetical protein